MPKPGPLGAEATLGATANQLGQPFGNCGLARKARQPPKIPIKKAPQCRALTLEFYV